MNKLRIAKIAKMVMSETTIHGHDINKLKALAHEFSKIKGFEKYKFDLADRDGEEDTIYLYFNYIDGDEEKNVDEIYISVLNNEVRRVDFSREDVLGTLDKPRECSKTLERQFNKGK